VSRRDLPSPPRCTRHVEGRRPAILVVDDQTRLDRNLGDVSDVIDANLSRRPVAKNLR
jgi:hypothetical protein